MKYRILAMTLAVLVTAVACTGGGDTSTDNDQDVIISDGELDFELDPTFGSVELDPGFEPDPYQVGVTSGGSVDVETLGLGSDCQGWAAEAPDYSLQLSEDSSMIRIFFVADDSDADATLIINGPSGDWACNDDYDGGYDPMVVFEPASYGRYDIWIGSYSAEDLIDGTLFITELAYDPGDVED